MLQNKYEASSKALEWQLGMTSKNKLIIVRSITVRTIACVQMY